MLLPRHKLEQVDWYETRTMVQIKNKDIWQPNDHEDQIIIHWKDEIEVLPKTWYRWKEKKVRKKVTDTILRFRRVTSPTEDKPGWVTYTQIKEFRTQLHQLMDWFDQTELDQDAEDAIKRLLDSDD